LREGTINEYMIHVSRKMEVTDGTELTRMFFLERIAELQARIARIGEQSGGAQNTACRCLVSVDKCSNCFVSSLVPHRFMRSFSRIDNDVTESVPECYECIGAEQ
jgi:hypothetical protein